MFYKSIPNFRSRGRSALKDRVRNLLGLRVDRALPDAGPAPHIGDHIGHGRVAMRVSEPMPHDLWDWLVFMKWRRIDPTKDRRTYQELPRDTFRKLVRCLPDERTSFVQQLQPTKHRMAPPEMA